MSAPPREQANSTLEPVPTPDHTAYIYPVQDHSAPYLVENAQKDIYHDGPQSATPARNWTRWPFLFLCGLLIAIFAGVAGGFIGKAIGNKQQGNDDVLPQQAQDDSSCATRTTPTPATTSPTPSGIAFERTVPVFVTGCSAETYGQKLPRDLTQYLRISYTTVCNKTWMGDDLFAGSFATPSDCIEACQMYNQMHTSERECVGGGFIPEWWNQEQAMAENPDKPYNCYLKSSTRNIGKNERDIEVVALCMAEHCDEIVV